MELLSQLDVQNPDHVSVITRSGRVIISVRKNGSDVTVGFPVNTSIFDTTPRPPLAQSAPTPKPIRDELRQKRIESAAARMSKAARFNTKLTLQSARQIKDMLVDKEIMAKFRSRHQAHLQIAQAYGVSVHAIRAIDKGTAWKSAWLMPRLGQAKRNV